MFEFWREPGEAARVREKLRHLPIIACSLEVALTKKGGVSPAFSENSARFSAP
jgi:hypothetical protein